MTRVFKVDISAPSIIKDGGTSAQYLMADGSVTTGGGGTTTNALTIGTGLSGTSFNGSAAVTIALNSATSTIIGGVYGITTTTSSNAGIGNNALLNNTGTFNTAVGHSAMYINTSGSNNVAVGYAALRSNSAGAENVAIGDSALFTNTASSNTAIGKNALYSNSSGNLNTAIGKNALYTASTAQSNVAIGENSLNLATNGSNTAIGYVSGSTLTTGSNNILIGYNAQPSTVTVSNQITLGDANITTFRIPGLSISASTTDLTAPSFVKSGGTSSQYLMADGSVTTGSIPDITPLDDISNYFDGTTNRFMPRYQGQQVTISNPFRLLLTINGIIQTVRNAEYVWQSMIAQNGVRVDNDGYIVFPEAVPAGSQFDARLMAGSTTTSITTAYPFRAMDIILGG